jgi:hypothetical protein
MVGKWHLNGQKSGPVARGFDEYYGMLHGFGTFWSEKPYIRLPAGRPLRSYLPGAFYATNAFGDYALDFLAEAAKVDKPWFLYLAFNAPHFPLHACPVAVLVEPGILSKFFVVVPETVLRVGTCPAPDSGSTSLKKNCDSACSGFQ